MLLEQKNELQELLSYLTPQELGEIDLLLAIEVRQNDPVRWIEENFYIPELDGPIELMPYQKAVLREAYRRDSNGQFVYSLVVWSDIKKSAKSSIAAAVVLHRARFAKWGSFKIVANDLKQADSRVAYYLRRAITLNPEMEDIKQVRYRTVFPNGSIIEAIPIDPGGEAGGNDDLIVFSELWAAKHQAIQQMWSEMTLSPTKFGYSQRWVETYAGYHGESPLLEQLYETGQSGKQLDLSYDDHDLSDLEVFANGPALVMWNTRPRCPWQTDEYYESEARVLAPSEFQRMHRNQWITSTETFVPPEWWDACQVDLPPLDNREPIVVSMDAGVSGDCFGISAVSRHVDYNDDGTVARDITKLRYGRKWEPPANGKIIYSNPENPNDREVPEGELRWLIANYYVMAVVYDEYQLHDFVQRLKFENLAHFKVFTQGKERDLADKQLYDCIRERNILHNGNPAVTEHIKNANQEQVGDNKLRLVKRAPSMKIDLAVCVSMANATIRKMNY